MPAKFELKKGKSGKFHFNLLAANGEVILSSQMYASKATAMKGIASVQANASQADRYERRKSKNGKPFFILKAANHRVIGQSEIYERNPSMENGIKSVMKNGSAEKVDDTTS